MSSVVSTSVPSKSKRAALSTAYSRPFSRRSPTPQEPSSSMVALSVSSRWTGVTLISSFPMAARIVVDVVADSPLLLAHLYELVLVEAAAEPRDPGAPEPLSGHVGRVDVEDAALGQPLEGDLGQPGSELGRWPEVQVRLGPCMPRPPDT